MYLRIKSIKQNTMKKWLVILWFSLLSTKLLAQSLGSLMVVNKGGNTMSILDLDLNTELTRIPTGEGSHEVAVSPDGKIAVVCNYGNQTPNNSLTIIDIAQKSSIKKIDLGIYQRPHGIEFIAPEEVIVTSEVAQALIKVNIKTDAVTEVVKTNQEGSHIVAYCKADGKAYVANRRSGSVSVVDVKGNKLLKTIVLKPGTEGLDISPNGKELWVANQIDSTVTIINAQTFKEEALLYAHQNAIRVKFLPNGKYSLISNAKTGNVSVYDVAARRLIKDIDLFNLDKGIEGLEKEKDLKNPPIPVGITTHPSGKFVYIAAVNYGAIAVIDTANWEVVATIRAGASPDGLYHSPLKIN
jgi:YVTN family beta-propeller protein